MREWADQKPAAPDLAGSLHAPQPSSSPGLGRSRAGCWGCMRSDSPNRPSTPSASTGSHNSPRSASSSPQPCAPPPLWTPRLPHRTDSDSATHHNLCLMCGAPAPAAHKSAAPTPYPIASRSARTPASHSRPSFDVTCSPNTTGGAHSPMSRWNSGHRCRSSLVPPRLPAQEKGWQGQEPVQTCWSSGHPASLSASGHPPIPAKKWQAVKPRRSVAETSRIDRSSTSPSGRCPAAMRLRSHWQQYGSSSL